MMNQRWRAGVPYCAALLAGLLLIAPSAGRATSQLCLDVSDPSQCARLTKGEHYEYGVQFAGTTFLNEAGEILDWAGTVEFLGFPDGEGGFADYWLLVLPGFTHTDALPPPLANVDYLPDSFRFLDSSPVERITVTDGSPGQISDAFGGSFLALVLPAEMGGSSTFYYQIRLNEPLTNPSEFAQWNTAFLPVPEPGTLGLVALGLVALGLVGSGLDRPGTRRSRTPTPRSRRLSPNAPRTARCLYADRYCTWLPSKRSR